MINKINILIPSVIIFAIAAIPILRGYIRVRNAGSKVYRTGLYQMSFMVQIALLFIVSFNFKVFSYISIVWVIVIWFIAFFFQRFAILEENAVVFPIRQFYYNKIKEVVMEGNKRGGYTVTIKEKEGTSVVLVFNDKTFEETTEFFKSRNIKVTVK